MRECQMAEHKVEATRQRNLAKLQAEGAHAGTAVQSAQEEGAGSATYLAQYDQMQQAFETLLLGCRIFSVICAIYTASDQPAHQYLRCFF